MNQPLKNTTITDLKRARQLIEDPSNWMRGDKGWDGQGGRYCVEGALIRACDSPGRYSHDARHNKRYHQALRFLRKATPAKFLNIYDMNDSPYDDCGHPAVMKAYSKAIKAAEAATKS